MTIGSMDAQQDDVVERSHRRAIGGAAQDPPGVAGPIRTSPLMTQAIQEATMALKRASIERALGGQPSHHLGCLPGGDKPAETGIHRNSSTGFRIARTLWPWVLRPASPLDRAPSRGATPQSGQADLPAPTSW